MGCVPRKPEIKVNILTENHSHKTEIVTYKNTSTLYKINKLNNISKNMKLKNVITQVHSFVKDNYEIIKKLGKGSYGSVFKVRHKKLGIFRALKIIKKDSVIYQDDAQIFLKEIEVLKEVEHPNIIKIFEYYIDIKNYYVISELLEGGELYESIIKSPNFNENKASFIMKQILSALHYLHSKGIVHRDIKAENILVYKNTNSNNNEENLYIKIIDFGASNYFKKNKKLTLKIGSPYYVAPEVLNKLYNEKCDIWSAGVVLYVILTGNFPFTGKKAEELFNHILAGEYKQSGKEWDAISTQGKDLISLMLQFNPDERPSAQECLEHPWIKNNLLEKKINYCNNNNSVLLPSVLKNIYHLNVKEKLREMTIATIIHNNNFDEEEEKLKDVFDLMDLDKDGKLTFDEIKEAFNKLFPDIISNKKMKQIWNEMDDNKDKVVSYEEFLRVTISQKKIFEKNNLKLAFDTFDLNKDGKLSKEELVYVLNNANSEYVDILISLIDKNQDGFLSFEEFCDLILKVNSYS